MTSSSAYDERQPLLPPSPDKPAKDHATIWKWPMRTASASRDFLIRNPILICTFCLQFCNYFAKHMVEVPTIKLFEQAICNRYYRSHSSHEVLVIAGGQLVEERYCKIAPIQNELAALVGLKFTFDALPGK